MQFSAGNEGIHPTEEEDTDVEHTHNKGIVANKGMGTNGKIQSHQPYGDCGFVEMLFSANKCDEHIEQGGCHRQNDLTPHVPYFP